MDKVHNFTEWAGAVEEVVWSEIEVTPDPVDTSEDENIDEENME